MIKPNNKRIADEKSMSSSNGYIRLRGWERGGGGYVQAVTGGAKTPCRYSLNSSLLIKCVRQILVDSLRRTTGLSKEFVRELFSLNIMIFLSRVKWRNNAYLHVYVWGKNTSLQFIKCNKTPVYQWLGPLSNLSLAGLNRILIFFFFKRSESWI